MPVAAEPRQRRDARLGIVVLELRRVEMVPEPLEEMSRHAQGGRESREGFAMVRRFDKPDRHLDILRPRRERFARQLRHDGPIRRLARAVPAAGRYVDLLAPRRSYDVVQLVAKIDARRVVAGDGCQQVVTHGMPGCRNAKASRAITSSRRGTSVATRIGVSSVACKGSRPKHGQIADSSRLIRGRPRYRRLLTVAVRCQGGPTTRHLLFGARSVHDWTSA